MSNHDKQGSRQLPLNFSERGRQFWLLNEILERLPDPPTKSDGKTYFSRATANSVLRQVDQLTFCGSRITPNAIAAACDFRVPKAGQHGNVRRILNWCESLGIIAIVRCTKGGHQALEPRLCFAHMEAVVCDGEPFCSDSIDVASAVDLTADVGEVDSQVYADRCVSNYRPLCVKLPTVVCQTTDRCVSDTQPLIKHINTNKQVTPPEKVSGELQCVTDPKASPSQDADTAEWMLAQVRAAVDPHCKASPKWAEAVRLMRERDRRSDAEIRELFSLARQHTFWSKNILSPQALRKHWPKLVAQMEPSFKPTVGQREHRRPVKAGRRSYEHR